MTDILLVSNVGVGVSGERIKENHMETVFGFGV